MIVEKRQTFGHRIYFFSFHFIFYMLHSVRSSCLFFLVYGCKIESVTNSFRPVPTSCSKARIEAWPSRARVSLSVYSFWAISLVAPQYVKRTQKLLGIYSKFPPSSKFRLIKRPPRILWGYSQTILVDNGCNYWCSSFLPGRSTLRERPGCKNIRPLPAGHQKNSQRWECYRSCPEYRTRWVSSGDFGVPLEEFCFILPRFADAVQSRCA